MSTEAASDGGLRRRLLGAGVALATGLGGCGLFKSHRSGDEAALGEAGSRQQVIPFSASPPNGQIPHGWSNSGFWNSRRRTSFRTVSENDVTILEAEAEQSASGLFCNVHIAAERARRLRWRWRTRELITDADVSRPDRDDAVARVIVSFDGPAQSLSFKDMLFREQALLFAGIDLPHSMLIYVWDTHLPVGSVYGIGETTRIKYLVAESGTQRLSQWVDYDRDLQLDFVKAFGEAHGNVLNVGVTTDANDTHGYALSYYGDIRIDPT
ncbi:MAG: DUF3047 domain-containing protein [Burkholderiaceae bacterium]